MRLGHDLALPIEVLEVRVVDWAVVIEMARLAISNDLAVDDFECVRVVFGFLPTGEILAIEKTVPAIRIGFWRFSLCFRGCVSNFASKSDYDNEQNNRLQISHRRVQV